VALKSRASRAAAGQLIGVLRILRPDAEQWPTAAFGLDPSRTKSLHCWRGAKSSVRATRMPVVLSLSFGRPTAREAERTPSGIAL
jgi:hypothetical protein